MIKKRVPHNFKYHAEIQYETYDGFNFTNASGNTVEELLWDIDFRFDQFKDRFPEIVTVLEDPNTNNITITDTIIKLFFSRRKGA